MPVKGFTAELVDDNLYEWHIKCFGFDPDSQLASDLKKYKEKFGLVCNVFIMV